MRKAYPLRNIMKMPARMTISGRSAVLKTRTNSEAGPVASAVLSLRARTRDERQISFYPPE